jgi:hypothetical protein
MGNMSNPNINRWGLNLFWYRYWYTDNKFSKYLNHDWILNKIVYSYLNFGITHPTNIFTNKYWWLDNLNLNHTLNHSSKYFRVMSFKNFISNEIDFYNDRLKIENVYQSKIWILKFQHWILINFYCFNPLKKKQIERSTRLLRKEANAFTKTNLQKNYLKKRIRFLFFFFWKKQTKYLIIFFKSFLIIFILF